MQKSYVFIITQYSKEALLNGFFRVVVKLSLNVLKDKRHTALTGLDCNTSVSNFVQKKQNNQQKERTPAGMGAA